VDYKQFEELILKCYQGKTVAILGWDHGGQQRADFLRNHGIQVVIGLRIGDPFWDQAANNGFTVLPVWEAVEQSQIAQVW
jgi:ketol-acid reductoisomerase